MELQQVTQHGQDSQKDSANAFDLDFDVVDGAVMHCGRSTSSTLTMEFFVTIGEENWSQKLSILED